VGLNVVEIHSRNSQGARNAAAERFKKETGIFLFSSDVSARGMDFPGVTRVIQVSLTDRESYIHRLGRTARAGRGGAGFVEVDEREPPLPLRL
jgi:ATP-dependent RNA helicase MSS116